ncbi:hypothetical protein [Microbacterium sp.]|uniref:hypothetical protein n=1 Tax=Microbacterium sp. TaxID=51671 RepID=UPI003C7579A1
MAEEAPDYTIAVRCDRHTPPVGITTLYHYPTWRPLGTAWAPDPQLGDDAGFVRYDTINDTFDGISREAEPDRWLAAVTAAHDEVEALLGTAEYAAAQDAYTARKRSHMTLTLTCVGCSRSAGAALNATMRIDQLDGICDRLRHAGLTSVTLSGLRGILSRNR